MTEIFVVVVKLHLYGTYMAPPAPIQDSRTSLFTHSLYTKALVSVLQQNIGHIDTSVTTPIVYNAYIISGYERFD